MKIERTHYKEWHEETVQIVSAAEKMQDTMTEEERSAADAESLAEFNRILAEAQAQKVRTWVFQKHLTRLLFKRLSERLLVYAQEDPADIIIEANKEHGMIRMEFGQLILDDLHPAWHLRLWRRLMRYADDIWVNPIEKYGESAIQYTFIFDFQWSIEWKRRPNYGQIP